MKKIIFLILNLLIISGFSLAQTKWTEVTYHYQTGTIPPPHYYKYDFTVNSSGFGTLVYFPDYSEMTTWVYAVKLTEEEIAKLDRAITQSNILNETIPSLPDSMLPIGGPLQNLTIMMEQDPNLDQLPPRISIPYFPSKEYEEKVDGVYNEIKNLIPQSTWDEIKTRKDEFIKNYGK
jgi:hypothetical protein